MPDINSPLPSIQQLDVTPRSSNRVAGVAADERAPQPDAPLNAIAVVSGGKAESKRADDPLLSELEVFFPRPLAAIIQSYVPGPLHERACALLEQLCRRWDKAVKERNDPPCDWDLPDAPTTTLKWLQDAAKIVADAKPGTVVSSLRKAYPMFILNCEIAAQGHPDVLALVDELDAVLAQLQKQESGRAATSRESKRGPGGPGQGELQIPPHLRAVITELRGLYTFAKGLGATHADYFSEAAEHLETTRLHQSPESELFDRWKDLTLKNHLTDLAKVASLRGVTRELSISQQNELARRIDNLEGHLANADNEWAAG